MLALLRSPSFSLLKLFVLFVVVVVVEFFRLCSGALLGTLLSLLLMLLLSVVLLHRSILMITGHDFDG